jgi:hypothetical protein
VTEDLTVPSAHELDGLEAVYRGLCRLPHIEDSKRRRIDFLTVPWECRGAALLYYTVRFHLPVRLWSASSASTRFRGTTLCVFSGRWVNGI